jgi:phosphoserine phosphatase
MKELRPYLAQHDGLLVVFDIDSTILKLYNENERVPWFCNELRLLKNVSKKSREELYKEMLDQHSEALSRDYVQELRTVHIELAEKITGKIISTLFEQNIPFLIETKRGLAHIDITHKQLDSVGVRDKTIKKWGSVCFELSQGLPAPAYYDNGILFVSIKNDKGDALKALLKRLGYKPKRLVAIDDERDNLVAFQNMADTMGIDFIGLRYGFLDEFTRKTDPKTFDPLNCFVTTT